MYARHHVARTVVHSRPWMRFVIQIEGIVISAVRAGPAVMPRSSQKTASHLVSTLSEPAVSRAVRVIERVVRGETTSYGSPLRRPVDGSRATTGAPFPALFHDI